MPKVFISRKIIDAGIKMLVDKGYEVVVGSEEIAPQEEVREKARGADAIIAVIGQKIDGTVMEAAGPQLKIIASYAVGVDHIDLNEAKKRHIIVTNTPGSNANCVAEHTLGLILDICHRITESDRFTRRGLFKGWGPELLLGDEISNNILGIVGLGQIGQRVAKICRQGFSMTVYYYDVKRNESLEKELGLIYFPVIEEMLKVVDILTLHVPLLDSTRHLINKERMALMKPGAYLINTCRGPVIDEIALVEALKNKKLRGAALDVYEQEPLLTPGLAELENVVLTPHTAAASYEARLMMAQMAVDNVMAVLEGRPPLNPINI